MSTGQVHVSSVVVDCSNHGEPLGLEERLCMVKSLGPQGVRSALLVMD